MAKVSVIIPIYNEEKYLPQCLDSICGQTLEEIEIICVDDGSTDSTPRILEDYRKKDPRIQVVTQKNQFAGAARNKGMEYASGKYLSFLDGDDYYQPDMLEKMVEKAEEDRSDLVICRYRQCCGEEKEGEGDAGMLQNSWEFEDLFLDGKEAFSGKELLCGGIFQIAKGWPWDKLFRADFVNDCGYRFPEFRSSEDGFFVYMLMARAGRISYRKEELAIHRINIAGSLSNTREKDWENGFKMWSLLEKELKKQELYGIYERSLLNELLYFLLWYLESMKTFEAFRNCYQYIQRRIEPEFGILSHGKEFYFQEELYSWYREVMERPPEDYLSHLKIDSRGQ